MTNSTSTSNLLDDLFGGRTRFIAVMIGVVCSLQLMRLSGIWTPTNYFNNPFKHKSEIMLLVGCIGFALVVAWLQGGFLQGVTKDDQNQRMNRFWLAVVFSAVFAASLFFMNILRPKTDDFLGNLSVVVAAGFFFLFLMSSTIGLFGQRYVRTGLMMIPYLLMAMGSVAFVAFLIVASMENSHTHKKVEEIWLFGVFIGPLGLLLFKFLPQAFALKSEHD